MAILEFMKLECTVLHHGTAQLQLHAETRSSTCSASKATPYLHLFLQQTRVRKLDSESRDWWCKCIVEKKVTAGKSFPHPCMSAASQSLFPTPRLRHGSQEIPTKRDPAPSSGSPPKKVAAQNES